MSFRVIVSGRVALLRMNVDYAKRRRWRILRAAVQFTLEIDTPEMPRG